MSTEAGEPMEQQPDSKEHPVPSELLEKAVDISPDQDGGVKKVILTEGTGDEKPGVGNEVTVHYVGTLTNGTQFDSSRDRNDKFKFKLGVGQVIRAWDVGVASMRRGERCKLICRGDYAYGERGSPPNIPPNATLLFDVELFDWKGEDLTEVADGGIIRNTIEKGEGYLSPNEGSQVQVDVKGTYDGKVFDERSVSFSVGDALEQQLPEGIDIAIRKFKKGERSMLTLSSKYAFGSEGHSQYDIPPNADIKYEVTLKEFEKAKESWEMEPAEKISQSELAKSKGTTLLKEGKIAMAIKKYKLITKWFDDTNDFSEEQKQQANSLSLAANLNLALCYQKLEDWTEVKEHCNKALEIDSRSEKAYFRRGQAYMGNGDYSEAKQDFLSVLNIDSGNKAARNQITQCDEKLKKEREREKKLYASMFGSSKTSTTAANTSINNQKKEATTAEDGTSV